MSAEPPEPDEQAEEPDEEVQEWPTPSPKKDDIWFMDADDIGDVAARISNGAVQKRGVPAHLFSELIKRAGKAIHDVGNLSIPPLVIGAHAGASMTVVFGEAPSEPVVPQLLDNQVLRSAEVIGRLIEAKDDDLINAAYGVGQGAAAYAELVHLIESEGLTLDWKTRDQPPRRLDQETAERQYERLSQPPETRERSRRIEGYLYRAIIDRPGYGTAGVKLSEDFVVPHRGRSPVLRYEGLDIERRILHELLGQMIVAKVLVVEVDPQSRSIGKPEIPSPLIQDIEASHKPVTLDLFGGDETTQA